MNGRRSLLLSPDIQTDMTLLCETDEMPVEERPDVGAALACISSPWLRADSTRGLFIASIKINSAGRVQFPDQCSAPAFKRLNKAQRSPQSTIAPSRSLMPAPRLRSYLEIDAARSIASPIDCQR